MDKPTSVNNGKSNSFSGIKRLFIRSYLNFLLIAFWIFCLLLNGDVTPITRRGFFCNDSSINYPFKQDTIGVKTLFLIALMIPVIVIKICDKALNKKLSTSPHLAKRGSKPPKKARKFSDNALEVNVEEEELIAGHPKVKRRNAAFGGDSEINDSKSNQSGSSEDSDFEQIPKDEIVESEYEEIDLFRRVSLNSDQDKNGTDGKQDLLICPSGQRPIGEVQLYFFGLCATMFFTGLGKITCGRFRPHFMQRCKPDVDCTTLTDMNQYHEEFTCTNSELRSRDMSYITTSWPSGHASIMFFSMVYMVIFLNTIIPILVRLSSKQVRRRFDILALYAIYVLMISLAMFIAMTRVSDYHHHATDVFSGSVLGTFIALSLSRSMSGRFSSKLTTIR